MTSTHLAIACSLSSADLKQRVADMARVGAAAFTDYQRAGRRLTLHFRADHDVRPHLRAIVAAESECCAFLEMELIEDESETTLQIIAPAGAEPVLDDLLAAFNPAEAGA